MFREIVMSSSARTRTMLPMLWWACCAGDGQFASLASRAGVHSRVRLGTPLGGGERGLFVVGEPVKAGEPVLAVPFSLCLTCELDSGPSSPWDAPSERDLALASQLLDALSATEAVSDRDAFWQAWREMLPEPAGMSHPVTLPPHLLAELHDSTLADAARRQQLKVDAVLGAAYEHCGVEVRSLGVHANESTRAYTGTCTHGWMAACTQVCRWAVAMCSSRPFSLPIERIARQSELSEGPGARGQGPGARVMSQLTAFVPFVDVRPRRARVICMHAYTHPPACTQARMHARLRSQMANHHLCAYVCACMVTDGQPSPRAQLRGAGPRRC